MAAKTFTLVDAERNLYEPAWQATPADFGKAAGCSARKTTLTGGVKQGVDIIEIDNGAFRFVVVPTRGMNVWKGWLGELEVGWKSPIQGPVHPQYVALSEPSGLGWLDGFDELISRCGLVSNGAPDFDPKTGRLLYGLHGKIANKPAHFVEVSIDPETSEITVLGIVDESRFHFEKLRLTTTLKTKAGEKGFRLYDEVTNLGGTPVGMQLLYHINFSQPILDAGARVVAPVKTMVPRDARAAEGIKTWDSYPGDTAGFAEQCYFFELNGDAAGNTQVLLKNAHGMQGASLKYPVKQLPCFTVWKDTMANADGYVTGLEPATNFPNPRSFEAENGRVVTLAPGESRKFEVGFEVHPDAASISAAELAIAKIQGDRKPQIFDKPQKGWTKV